MVARQVLTRQVAGSNPGRIFKFLHLFFAAFLAEEHRVTYLLDGNTHPMLVCGKFEFLVFKKIQKCNYKNFSSAGNRTREHQDRANFLLVP